MNLVGKKHTPAQRSWASGVNSGAKARSNGAGELQHGCVYPARIRIVQID